MKSKAQIVNSRALGIGASVFSVLFYVALSCAAHAQPQWAGGDSSTMSFALSIVFLAVAAWLLVRDDPRTHVRAAKAIAAALVLCAIAEAYEVAIAFTSPPDGFEGPKVGFAVLQVFVTAPVVIIAGLLSLAPIKT